MDVPSSEDWRDAVAEAVKAGKRLDIVINNSGVNCPAKPAFNVPFEEFERLFSVNVKSNFLSIQAAVPAVEKCGRGSIVKISSISSIRPRPRLAAELGLLNIRVNAIAPLLAGNTGLFEVGVGLPDTP
ncbi:NAD(P)-binding protein [Thozetella sp. PMI_491]|nr:NAD(P)-binding protein [Thozetella sp. PMI_491]